MRVEKRKIAIILFLVIIINTIPDSFVSLIHLEKMYAADENYNNATCGNASCSNASCGNATCCDACKPYTLKIVDDYNIFGTGNEEIVYDNLDGNKMINEYIDELNLSYNHDYFEFENIWVDVNGNIISNMMLKNIADITSHCVCVYPRLKLKNNIAEIVLKDNKKCSNDEIRNISSTGWINDVVCVRLKCMNSNEAGQECTKLDGVDIEVNGKKEGNIFNFTEETEDSFKIKLVGSKSYLLSSEEFVLKIDNKKPVIEITSIDFPADEYKKQRTVTFSVSDSGSGIDENKVFVELPSGEDAVSTKNEKDLYSFVVEQNGDYIITVSDLAENIGEYKYIEERITSDGPIITDVKYSDNTEITEEYVGDNNNDRKVIFNVNKSGKGCEITDVSYITGEGENAALYTLGNHDGEYEIPFSQFNEGKNPLTINAADTSGNQTSCHVNIFKDTTSPDKPVITADKSGKIVKENITFTVTATDGNAGFNEGSIVFNPKTDFDIKKIYENIYDNNGVNTYEYSFLVEGDVMVDFSASVKDKAGNQSKESEEYTVIIDSTSPILKFNYSYVNEYGVPVETDSDKTTDKLVSNSKITAKLEVSEEDVLFENYSSEYVFDIKLYNKDKSYCAGYSYGDVISITEEGEYYVEVYAKDEVGNDVLYNSCELVIDKTTPVIKPEENGGILTNTDLNISYCITDYDSGLRGVWYSFDNISDLDFDIPSLSASEKNYESAYNENDKFTITKTADENFNGYCHVWSYDNAGNYAVFTRSVIIDIDKPEISVSYKYKDAESVIRNADSSSTVISSNELVTVYLSVSDNLLDLSGDGVIYELFDQNNVPYTVENIVHNNGDDVWSGEINIVSHGVYRLHFAVYDEAGNQADIYPAEINIDTNNPGKPIISIDNSIEAVSAPYTITITATDNGMGFDDNGIIYAGIDKKYFKSVEIESDETGREHAIKYTFEVDEEFRIENMYAVARDKTGNFSDETDKYSMIIDAESPALIFDCTYIGPDNGEITLNNGESILKGDEGKTVPEKISSKSEIIVDIEVTDEDELFQIFKDKYIFDITLYKNNEQYNKYNYGEQIKISGDGEYVIKAGVTDEVGHYAYFETCKLIIDEVSPYISADDNYEIWTNKNMEMSYSVTDNTTDYDTGLNGVWYTFDNSEEFEVPSFSESYKYNQAEKVSEAVFTVVKTALYNFDGYCHIWSYDNVGNVNAITHRVLTDIERPELKIKGVENEKIYNTDIAVIFQSNDFIGDNKISSGFDRVDYKIEYSTDDKSVLSEGKLDNNGGIVNIDAEENNADKVVIRAIAYDNARNYSDEESVSFAVDTAAPEITVQMIPEESEKDNIYNNEKTVLITIKERHFDWNLLSIDTNGEILEKREAGQYLYEVLVKFDADDNEYRKLIISCKDLAGNEAVADDIIYLGGASEKFIIDCTKPVIDVKYKYTDAGGNIVDAGSSSSRLYSNKTVTAYLSVSDGWLDEAGDGVDFELTDQNGHSVTMQNIIHDEGADNWSGEINITSDGVYRLHFTVYDEAGNSNEINLAEIVIDKKAPDVSITRDNTSWTNNSFSIEGRVSDGSDDNAVGFYNKVYYVFNNSEDFSAPEFKNAVGSGYGTVEPGGNGIFAIDRGSSSDFDGYCHIWAYDNAGNLSTVRTTRVRVDKTLPSVTISAEDVNKVMNTDYMVTITADDGISNGVRSGLSYISYVVTADGTRTQEGSVALEGESSYSIQVNIDAHANENSEITITASVGDLAGNTNNAETISARTDVTRPEIRVSYDNNSVLNEKYFSSDRTATITIIDKNFDENLVEITTEGRISGWTHSGDIHTSSVVYDTDGDYEFDINCTDLAGNSSLLPDYGVSVEPTSFTIDKTMPVINITYDNNDVENGNYYKAARTATIHITEHNFDPATAGIEISPAVGAWTSDGDEHFAVISFTEDGIHTLDVSYTDLAGNTIAENVHEEFVIDKAAPVITVSDIINRKAYNSDVIAPAISVTDDNFDASRVEIRLTGGNQGDVTAKYLTSSLTATSGYYKFANILEDDLYTLEIVVYDKAGNSTTVMSGEDSLNGRGMLESVLFSVNRNGSVYSLDSATKQLVEKAYVKSSGDIVFFETNVNILNRIRITVAKDNQSKSLADMDNLDEITLEEGNGYTIKREEINGGWSQYKYIIDKDNFTEDGIYRVTVYSLDEAGNISENTMETKLQEINFIVDTTMPVCIVSDMASGKSYNMSEKTVTFEPSDNLLLDTVKVYLNGEEIAYWTDAEHVDDFSFTIGESTQKQSVLIVCTDAAGNVLEDIFEDIYVTTSKWIQFINNKGLLYGSILSLILLLSILMIITIGMSGKKRVRRNA